jgi:hypothetical protein
MRLGNQFSQQGRLARPGLSRQKNRLIGLVDKLFDKRCDVIGFWLLH